MTCWLHNVLWRLSTSAWRVLSGFRSSPHVFPFEAAGLAAAVATTIAQGQPYKGVLRWQGGEVRLDVGSPGQKSDDGFSGPRDYWFSDRKIVGTMFMIIMIIIIFEIWRVTNHISKRISRNKKTVAQRFRPGDRWSLEKRIVCSSWPPCASNPFLGPVRYCLLRWEFPKIVENVHRRLLIECHPFLFLCKSHGTIGKIRPGFGTWSGLESRGAPWQPNEAS